MSKLYRYVSNGEGTWSAGKRLLPENLVDEANANRKWLSKPDLPAGEYRFWLNTKGMKMYEKTLLITHMKYLPNIEKIEVARDKIGEVVFEDEFQVVEKVSKK